MTHLVQPTTTLEIVFGNAQSFTRADLTSQLRVQNGGLWGHARTVAQVVERVCRSLSLPPDETTHAVDAAWVHDIGKLTISPEILNKPGALDPDEWVEMQAHATRGADYLLTCESLRTIAPIVRHHHEWIDGYGYPDGLRGECIPVASRVISVVDAFDAMTTSRPYQRQRSTDEALAELRRCSGTQFDPLVVEQLVRLVRDRER
ncbi:MAG: HD domain-containing protein [Thermomicrobiales bacterium]|nr:HD domain-containing protein [Thermomicrobiales bacterium]